MKHPLFVDTNYFCSLYNDHDSQHEKAKSVSDKTDDYDLIVSNFVLLETYTILSQRISKQFVVHFGKEMQREDLYTIVWVDKQLEEEVWAIFASIKNKNFSYVDASIIAVMQKRNIHYLLSLDKTFTPLQKHYNFQLIGA